MSKMVWGFTVFSPNMERNESDLKVKTMEGRNHFVQVERCDLRTSSLSKVGTTGHKESFVGKRNC